MVLAGLYLAKLEQSFWELQKETWGVGGGSHRQLWGCPNQPHSHEYFQGFCLRIHHTHGSGLGLGAGDVWQKALKSTKCLGKKGKLCASQQKK